MLRKPKTRNPKPETRNLKAEIRNPKLETRNPKPGTLIQPLSSECGTCKTVKASFWCLLEQFRFWCLLEQFFRGKCSKAFELFSPRSAAEPKPESVRARALLDGNPKRPKHPKYLRTLSRFDEFLR
jgi:hypothetical protein